jgi:hypothetical protein
MGSEGNYCELHNKRHLCNSTPAPDKDELMEILGTIDEFGPFQTKDIARVHAAITAHFDQKFRDALGEDAPETQDALLGDGRVINVLGRARNEWKGEALSRWNTEHKEN